MPQSPKEVWKLILDEASRQLPDKVVRAWLEPTEAMALENDRLVVAAPDAGPDLMHAPTGGGRPTP